MRDALRFRSFLVLVIGSMLLGQGALGQKQAITPEDYDKWESLGGGTLSPDGNWLVYSISPVEGDGTLFIKNLDTEEVKEVLVGSGAVFSDDSQWVAYRVGVPEDEAEKLREQDKPTPSKVKLWNLAADEEVELSGARSFRFAEGSQTMILQMSGKNIVIRNLESGMSLTVGNVSTYSINDKGDRLAYVVDAADKAGNGVMLVDLNNFAFKVLDSDTVDFKSMVWDEDGEALAYLKSFEDEGFEEANHKVVVIKDIYGQQEREVFDPTADRNFPRGMRIADEGSLRWSDDLGSMFFGIKEWTRKEESSGAKAIQEVKGDAAAEKKKDPEKLPDMDIWHWKDDPLQPRQKLNYSRDERFTYLSVWHIDEGKFVQLAMGDQKQVSLSGDQKHAYATDITPYQPAFRLTMGDYYIIDTMTGERKMILKEFTGGLQASPGGRYYLYFKDSHWWVYDIEADRHRNLTRRVEIDFWNTRDDHPRYIKPSWGSGGWLKDDAGVLVYDEYDVWRLDADGRGGERLTNGALGDIQLRVQRIDYEEDYIDLDEPMFLRAYGDKTKKTGYFQRSPNGEVEKLVFEDMSISGLAKAKEADRYTYRAMSYVKSPNLFLVDGDFEDAVQQTDTNKQQEDFLWGKTELIDYINADGKPLQGALYYPAGYEEGKKYPMLIYIYEIVSNGIHRYVAPSAKSSYNTTNYVSQGYFVFMPDIIYKINHPGESAVDCVVPAVREVIKTGMIDEKQIGIMGHSWGAYQTAFIITQTDLFSAAVAGAPLTDMISMSLEIYWNSGSGNQVIFETSQGRLIKPYWEILDEFIANSPIFQASNIQTPLLVTFGDKDGAVDWHQGIEMYSTMRRMEKEMIMLVYAGENHSVRKEENQLDYTRKINEFFDHHLKGKPAPKWIAEGVSYQERMKKEKKIKK
ncbi:MAG: S9 family peptidase [Planctomycetes bacterium]|nr:S9 family peptidase [Planctomycetota bacterium]